MGVSKKGCSTGVACETASCGCQIGKSDKVWAAVYIDAATGADTAVYWLGRADKSGGVNILGAVGHAVSCGIGIGCVYTGLSDGRASDAPSESGKRDIDGSWSYMSAAPCNADRAGAYGLWS